MNTIIRTHVKNQKRLNTLDRMIRSWYDKKLDIFGDLWIVDDNSPMQKELEEWAWLNGVKYDHAGGKPDTKNGLYYSMKLAKELDPTRPVLACVDDAVFGKGVAERIFRFFNEEEALLEYGFVGMFACYENMTRIPCKVPNADVWKVPPQILYALVAHIYHPSLRDFIIKDWEMILNNEKPYPQMCDDIYVKNLVIENNINIYNFMLDYAQHTGGDNRTFGESSSNSEYYSKMFVGE